MLNNIINKNAEVEITTINNTELNAKSVKDDSMNEFKKENGNDSDIVANAKNGMTEEQIEEVLEYFNNCLECFMNSSHILNWWKICNEYGFEKKYKNIIELFDCCMPLSTNLKIKFNTDRARKIFKKHNVSVSE
jgi:hypothetical protein